jgi:hypothetical protein
MRGRGEVETTVPWWTKTRTKNDGQPRNRVRTQEKVAEAVNGRQWQQYDTGHRQPTVELKTMKSASRGPGLWHEDDGETSAEDNVGNVVVLPSVLYITVEDLLRST